MYRVILCKIYRSDHFCLNSDKPVVRKPNPVSHFFKCHKPIAVVIDLIYNDAQSTL